LPCATEPPHAATSNDRPEAATAADPERRAWSFTPSMIVSARQQPLETTMKIR
jgi:hypothetical protein